MTTKYLRLFFNHAASKKQNNKYKMRSMQYTHKIMVGNQLKDNAYKIIMKILSQYLILDSRYLCRFYEFSTMIKKVIEILATTIIIMLFVI